MTVPHRVPGMADAPSPRFLELDDVAVELATSKNQIYALVRKGELEAVKIGGRGQWRVERDKLEEYIARMYKETRQFINDYPYDQEQEPEATVAAELGDVTGLAGMSNPLPPSAAVAGAGDTRAAAGPGNTTPLDHATHDSSELDR